MSFREAKLPKETNRDRYNEISVTSSPPEYRSNETEPIMRSLPQKGIDDPTVMNCFYRFVLFVFHYAEIIFFKNIKVSGVESIPKKGAVIFTANHPNALVDPSLILLHCDRAVKTMGKSTIFRGPGNWFFRSLGGIPVYRPMDIKRGEKVGANTDSFREVHMTLEHGGAFAIFPEGVSHTNSNLKEMKFGMAHMALNYLKYGREKSVNNEIPSLYIVPVGLSYMNNQHRFRSNVWIFFGQPYEVPANIVDLYSTGEKEDMRKAVRDFMSNISVLIRRHIITAPDWETVELILLAVNIFKPVPHTMNTNWCSSASDRQMPIRDVFSVASVIRKGAVILRGDPIAIALRSKLCLYKKMIDNLGMEDNDIRTHRELGYTRVILSGIFYTIASIVAFLICLPALIWNLPITIPAWFISHCIAGTERDVVSTVKFIVAFILFPIVYVVYVGVASWLCAYKIDYLIKKTNNLHVVVYIIIFSILFPVLGVGALLIYEAAGNFHRHLLRIIRITSYKSTVKHIKDLRKEFQEVLNAVFALMANGSVRAEVSDIYIGSEFMSRYEAFARLVKFVDDNHIRESSVLIPVDYRNGSCKMTELKSLVKAFYDSTENERHDLVDGTSLVTPTTIIEALATSAMGPVF